MRQLFIATVLLLTVPAFASAQLPLSTPGGFGGGVRPAMLGPSIVVPQFRPGGMFGGGFFGPGYPFGGIMGGFGYAPYYGYGNYGNQFSPFAPPDGGVSVPLAATGPTEPTLVLSNEFPAVLTLEFPAAAEVWVNGKKSENEPSTEWTLTSPTLKAGGNYTFEVKARWKSDGQTLEFERSYTVVGGQRSKAYVLAGTVIK